MRKKFYALILFFTGIFTITEASMLNEQFDLSQLQVKKLGYYIHIPIQELGI